MYLESEMDRVAPLAGVSVRAIFLRQTDWQFAGDAALVAAHEPVCIALGMKQVEGDIQRTAQATGIRAIGTGAFFQGTFTSGAASDLHRRVLSERQRLSCRVIYSGGSAKNGEGFNHLSRPKRAPN